MNVLNGNCMEYDDVKEMFVILFFSIIAIIAGHWGEATSTNRSHKEAQDSKEEEEEGSK